ncbi:MAG: hypothetical protein ACI9C3_001222, partial [Yoonia sp.]
EVRVSHRQKPRYHRVYAPLTIEAPIVSRDFVKTKKLLSNGNIIGPLYLCKLDAFFFIKRQIA